MAFANTSVFVKVVVFLLLAGFVLHVVGFTTTYWMKYSYRDHRLFSSYSGSNRYRNQRYPSMVTMHTGLWSSCVEAGGQEGCNSVSTDQGWFEACQAFETLGFIAALAALVLIILYIFVPATSGKRIVFILTLLACLAAAGCIMLGIIIYGSKVKDNLSWSFALCTIAGIIFGVSGLLLIVDMLKK